MPRKTEDQLQSWVNPPSESEQTRYEQTCKDIKSALEGWNFDNNSFEVYPKGSYPNNTNVVRDSDVDIAVELTGLRRHEFIHSAKDLGLSDFGLVPYSGDYSIAKFKDDVEAAMIAQFGSQAVERGNKAIHIRESSRNLKADVVVCQTLKSHPSPKVTSTRTGILIQPDQGSDIHNFPKHHLNEGVIKNENTQRRYKRLVRIVKRLENEMVDANIIPAVPSFLMESMVWNIPNHIFNQYETWQDRLDQALIHMRDADRKDWLEVNNIKFLFRKSQKWSEEEAHSFVLRAINYVGAA